MLKRTVLRNLLRRTWLITVASVLACAAFAAHAVASIVEASYLAPPLQGAKLPAPVAKPAPKPTKRDGTDFVARNMFCSSCAPAFTTGSTESFQPAAQLIATSIGKEAVATLFVPASSVQGSFGVGDVVPGVGKIERIGWISVELVDDTGRHGTISLVDLALQRNGNGGDGGAATPPPTEPWAGRIKKIDDHTFEVERELVRELVGGSVKPGTMRIVPMTNPDGTLKGLRMFGVKPGSLPDAIGLKNGDTLADVNGTHIDSANTLLELYSRIDQLSTVQLEGTRAGKPLGIELRLR